MALTRRHLLAGLTMATSASGLALAQRRPLGGLARREWNVDGVTREALVRIPQNPQGKTLPLIFVYHGHGGGMRQAALSFRTGQLWPDAIVVYPQGLPTPSRLVDPEGKKSGWQGQPGDQGDRDLRFFDAILASLRQEAKVDRVFVTGHSNGGAFTYLLWATRGEHLAAVAPSSAPAFGLFQRLKPKPAMHVAGKKDELVKFEWQQATINQVLKINGCGPGVPWADVGTLYPSTNGTPLVTYIHDGGHAFPRNTPELIVRFLKEQAGER